MGTAEPEAQQSPDNSPWLCFGHSGVSLPSLKAGGAEPQGTQVVVAGYRGINRKRIQAF